MVAPTNVMFYLVVVTRRAAHHVHVHRDIQEHAKKTITAHAIDHVLSHVCTPGDWILRHVKTVSPMEMGGLIAMIHQTIRWLMLRALSTMATHAAQTQNVHFIIYVVQTVHLGIPPAVPSITVVSTPQTMRAIKHVPGPVRKPAAPVDIPVRITHHRHRGNNITTVHIAMLLHQTAR